MQIAYDVETRAMSDGIKGMRTLADDLIFLVKKGHALDLNWLLTAPDEDFRHDVVEIRKHIDRATGAFKNLFEPRCLRPHGGHPVGGHYVEITPMLFGETEWWVTLDVKGYLHLEIARTKTHHEAQAVANAYVAGTGLTVYSGVRR